MDTTIESLGPRTFDSPLARPDRVFFTDDQRVLLSHSAEQIAAEMRTGTLPTSFEVAGPRAKLFFNPKNVTACIVTCGGLCPGLNDVIRSITYSLKDDYGVAAVLGARYGFEGLVARHGHALIELTHDTIDNIHERGGTVLGTSRGNQPSQAIVDTLVSRGIQILFAIGGDGTQRGAADIADEVRRRGLKIAVVGVPKTIDNDILYVEQTFGFHSAVEASRTAIQTAHEEAKSAWNGVGIVKLMGRDSGFIAAFASAANPVVNYCIVPEFPFPLSGEKGFLRALEARLERKRHAVIVVAEGAGQDWIEGETSRDRSGNLLKKDVGLFLKGAIEAHFKTAEKPVTVKYIDPSYTIRARPANSTDSALCLVWGNMAAHAAMAGKTSMLVGWWHQTPTHVPIRLATERRKQLNQSAPLWQSVLSATEPVCLG